MTDWLLVALFGGLVGLDSTSFPQMMISRPLMAGALTGALLGRPLEGIMLGFIMESFSLIILPIGAARYPEPGTATVAATIGYAAGAPAGLDPGYMMLAVGFALVWEQVSGASVVLLRQLNGKLLARIGGVAPRQLERRHLGAMTLDFLRGAAVSVVGGFIALTLLVLLGPVWALPSAIAVPIMALLVAGMLGTGIALFGGWSGRKLALAGGVAAGIAAALVLT